MSSMLQVRIEDDLKTSASKVFDQLGIDLSTAIRMFLKKSVAVNGIPFDVKNDPGIYNAISALDRVQTYSEKNGLSDMSLDEINDIIIKARKAK